MWLKDDTSIANDRFAITMTNASAPPFSVQSTLGLLDAQLEDTGVYQCRAVNNLTMSNVEVFRSETVRNFNLTVLSKCAIYTPHSNTK